LRLVAGFCFDVIFLKGDITNPVIGFYAPMTPDNNCVTGSPYSSLPYH